MRSLFVDKDHGLIGLANAGTNLHAVMFVQNNQVTKIVDPQVDWKTNFEFPLVWLTNQYLPNQLFAYHQLERKLGGQSGMAGLLSFTLPH